jgi:hypothetical protein
MFSTTAVSVAVPRITRPGNRCTARIALAAAILVGGTLAAEAQTTTERKTAAQLSYVVRPDFAITATLGWATSRDIHSVGRPRLDVFTYDLGAEVRAPR